MTTTQGIYGLFQTNVDMEQQGVVLNYGDNAAGQPVRVKIARAGGSNARFAKALEARMRPYRRQFETGTLDDKVATAMLIEVFADSVILGWEGITDAAGNVLPYNRANVIKVLTDLPDLFSDIREQAMKSANYRAEQTEADSGN
jgi:hypothetical protein